MIKLEMSEAIVNTENSSMCSMGTDRLLDLFSFKSDVSVKKPKEKASGNIMNEVLSIDDVWEENEYSNLSVEGFLNGLLSS